MVRLNLLNLSMIQGFINSIGEKLKGKEKTLTC